jgi:coenzyme PQQ precursor peptide PqqA
MQTASNLLIPRYFGNGAHKCVNSLRTAAYNGEYVNQKISLANFSNASSLTARAEFVRIRRRAKMAWKTPKIVEVPVGMEINMYACAARK